MNKSIVTVACTTYNQEKYIAEAIESFLNQVTNFQIEIIIHDDASTDNTANIVAKFAKKYPKLIFPIFQKENQYSKGIKPWPNFVFPKAKGKYIAVCEGDDYWIDPLKLQKQVDFLESNKSYSFVFTPAVLKFNNEAESGKIRNRYDNFNSDNFELKNVLKLGGGFYPTATAMFKSSILDCEDNFLKLHSTGDYPLAILAALNGKIGYINEVSAVYRVQNNSVSNMLYKNCEDCNNSAEVKHKKNINFLNYLFERVELKNNFKQHLLKKEKYILLSKYLDCGSIKKVFNKMSFKNLGVKFMIRLLLKIIYVLFLRKNKALKVR